MSNDPVEEQATRARRGRTRDAWEWIARAREAAAQSVAPVSAGLDARGPGDRTAAAEPEPRPD